MAKIQLEISDSVDDLIIKYQRVYKKIIGTKIPKSKVCEMILSSPLVEARIFALIKDLDRVETES